MTHREFPAGKDPAFLFGCGRFRMEPNLLERSAEEILRFGRRPLLVCDDRSHAVAFDKVAASLAAAGVELRELRHNGFCCRDDALACARPVEVGAEQPPEDLPRALGGDAPERRREDDVRRLGRMGLKSGTRPRARIRFDRREGGQRPVWPNWRRAPFSPRSRRRIDSLLAEP